MRTGKLRQEDQRGFLGPKHLWECGKISIFCIKLYNIHYVYINYRFFKEKNIDLPAETLQKLSLLTDMVHKIVNGAVLDIKDINGETKSIPLYEYRAEDFMHLKKYILQNIPVHKVMVLMPHFLMELYQLNAYISPRLIV